LGGRKLECGNVPKFRKGGRKKRQQGGWKWEAHCQQKTSKAQKDFIRESKLSGNGKKKGDHSGEKKNGVGSSRGKRPGRRAYYAF